MLLDIFRNLVGGKRTPRSGPAPAQEKTPDPMNINPEHMPVYTGYMDKALVEKNMQIIFAGSLFAGKSFLDLYTDALEKTRTPIPPHKWYRRAQRALHLAHYHVYSLSLPGASAECGVLRGFSSMLLNTIAGLYPQHGQKDFYMLDSFEGLSEITDHDRVVTEKDTQGSSKYSKGDMSWALEDIKAPFDAFPQVNILKGWIPAVFEQLPERDWAFVHIDVDLHDPTLASLEYFYDRMVPGGVIINDDYASREFPGCGKAWREFCMARDIPFVKLDTGQAVILKQ